MKKIYKLNNIKINDNIKKIINKNIDEDNLEILSRISNGPGGYNISSQISTDNIPSNLKNIYKNRENSMLISFYHVAWHDDKKFATKKYPWFLIIVAQTHGKEYYLELGKKLPNKHKVLLKEGDVYLINTQIKHRVSYKGDVDGKPCSVIVDNTIIENEDIENFIKTHNIGII